MPFFHGADSLPERRTAMKNNELIQDLIDELNEMKLTMMASTLENIYRSKDFNPADGLGMLKEIIDNEYQFKMDRRYAEQLKRSHLVGGPRTMDKCVDSKERKYLPDSITSTLGTLDFIAEGLNVCILGPSDSGKTFFAKALGIHACTKYRVSYNHCEVLLEELVSLKQEDYPKYQKKISYLIRLDVLILDDFLLHTITDEREIKVLFEIMEKRSELSRSTIVCSQREPKSWASMILNDEVSSNAIMKRATKHYTVVIQPKS